MTYVSLMPLEEVQRQLDRLMNRIHTAEKRDGGSEFDTYVYLTPDEKQALDTLSEYLFLTLQLGE